jgi:hypothetical protein
LPLCGSGWEPVVAVPASTIIPQLADATDLWLLQHALRIVHMLRLCICWLSMCAGVAIDCSMLYKWEPIGIPPCNLQSECAQDNFVLRPKPPNLSIRVMRLGPCPAWEASTSPAHGMTAVDHEPGLFRLLNLNL